MTLPLKGNAGGGSVRLHPHYCVFGELSMIALGVRFVKPQWGGNKMIGTPEYIDPINARQWLGVACRPLRDCLGLH